MHVTQTYGPYIGLHREARRNDATCMCAKGYGGTGPSDECRVPCPGNRNQICGGANGVTFLHTFLGNWNVHCVSKNAPSLADCSFDKDGLILIIFGQLHQHTFKNDRRIQLSLFLHFYLLYLLSNSCNGNDAKQRVFHGKLLVAVKRAGCIVCIVCRLRKVPVLV